MDDDIIIVEVNTKIEEKSVLEGVKSLLNRLSFYGIKDVNITTTVNVEKQEEIKKLMESSHEEQVVKKYHRYF